MITAQDVYNPYKCYVCHEHDTAWSSVCEQCKVAEERAWTTANVLWSRYHSMWSLYGLRDALFELFRHKKRTTNLVFYLKYYKKYVAIFDNSAKSL